MKWCSICKKGSKKPAVFNVATYDNLQRDSDNYCCLSHVGSMVRRLVETHGTVAVRALPKEED